MNANYPLIFLISVLLTVISTLLVKYLAGRFNIVDKPVLERKIHKTNVPLLGGLAIFLSFFITLYFTRGQLLSGNLEIHHWLGFFIGACLLMIGGFLDDKYNLKPGWQFVFPVLASLAIVAGGVEIGKITNPLGGFLYLDEWKIPITEWGGAMRYFVVLSDSLIILWLLGMMYTTKLLDGLDGLVSGLGAIGGVIIFLFTITTKYYQPDIGLAALIFSACCLGFLFFNWHPAKIFLGEGGSLLLGFILGVLAIISGGKIAIALLVMGIPILDVIWTIIRRLAAGKNPFKFADRGHLHFRLLDLGLGQKKTVLIFYCLALIFGASGLFLQSLGKVLALSILFVLMLILVIGFSYLDKKKI
ncbi:MAG: MraY family glycosyltransferase [Patescibacteria group bacterium]